MNRNMNYQIQMKKNHQPIITESRKKFNQIVVPLNSSWIITTDNWKKVQSDY
jgi:hypothetical protein